MISPTTTKMKTTYFLFVVLTLSTSISKVIGSVGPVLTFFESDADFKHIHRNLLQEDDENEDTTELNDVENVGDDNSEEKDEKKGLFEPGTPKLGNYFICRNNQNKHLNYI